MRAVLERDYVAEAIRPRAFWARAAPGAVGSVILVGLAFGGAIGGTDSDRIGGTAFRATATCLFVFLCVAVPMLVVSGLQSERKGSTLEILLTTPEGAFGAAAGKFLARTGTALAWLAAALPPLTVAVLFGGTSWRTLGNTAFALLGTILELGGIAILVSALVRKPATGAVLAYLLPAAHWWGAGFLQEEVAPSPLALLGAATGPLASRDLADWDARLAPTAAAGFAGFLRHPGLIFAFVAALVALAAIPLAARALQIEDVGTREVRGRKPRSSFEGRVRAFVTGGNPVAWKESLFQDTAWSRFLYYLVIGLLLTGEVTSALLLRSGQWDVGTDGAYLAVVVTGLMGMGALQGAASMSFEKSGGAFEILRTTPMTATQIARGKILGTLFGMGFLLLIPASHLAIATVAGLHHPLSALAGFVILLLLTVNAAVHGITWGTVARSPAAALIGSGSMVIFVLFGWWGICILPFLLAGLRLLGRDDTADYFEIIVVPAVLCGSPRFLFESLLPALARNGGYGVDTAFAGVFALMSLVLSGFYLSYRWRRLPEVLAREMSRLSQGGDPRFPRGVFELHAANASPVATTAASAAPTPAKPPPAPPPPAPPPPPGTGSAP